MAQPRILTFNFHEPYLCLMARTGLAFDVGQYLEGRLAYAWHTAYRPVPSNLNLLEEKVWRERLNAGNYDVVIAHNEMNALDIVKAPGAKLLVCHNRATFLRTTVGVSEGDPVEAFNRLISRLRPHFEFIFISESKRDDYGLSGRVILPGIDVEDFGGYTGEQECVIRVGNMMRTRALMFDVDFQETVCQGLPSQVIGNDPLIPGAQPAPSFEALLAKFRQNRCMLHTSREGYEDGYNLAMLEAMACGMPVVSLANRTSPITDGVDGFSSYNAPALHKHLVELLSDRDLAYEIGSRGRAMAAQKFPLSAFVEKWRTAIFEAADGNRPRPHLLRPQKRHGILLHYLSSPFTTARYFEESAHGRCNVLTVGPRLPEEILRQWGFGPPIPPYPPQRIPFSFNGTYADLWKALPNGYAPDLYLWVDSGIDRVADDIHLLPMPKIAYLIDTHVNLEPRLEAARHFDVVFLAQKAQVEQFRAAGISCVEWLPLACMPSLYPKESLERVYDVAYVGSLNLEDGGRRARLFEEIARYFPNNKIGRFWPEDMARIYSQAKIVVNASHNKDVNMRVFEAMAAGALLITDSAIGLEDLFEDGNHLVIYRSDEDVIELIRHYLDNPEERERIAKTGQELVQSKHTYAQRLEVILREAERIGEEYAKRPSAPKDREYYEHPRYEVIQHIPFRTRRLLDVGCGAGVLGATLKKEFKEMEVTGVEMVEDACRKAQRVLDRVLQGDIETMEFPFDEGYFDSIVCADVLEHVVHPEMVLKKLARYLEREGVIVISLPNVQYHEVVAMLVSGAWTYMNAGILDSTHVRFFTRQTAIDMVRDAGLEVAHIGPLNIQAPEKLPCNPDRSLSLHKLTMEGITDEEYEQFLVYQWVVLACHPGVDRLEKARKALDLQHDEAAYLLAADAVGVDERDRHHLMAKALVRLGRLDEAETNYREALKGSETPGLLAEYGTLLVGMNRPSEAKPWLEKALATDAANHRALGALGLVMLAEGNQLGAFEYFKKTLSSNFDQHALVKPFVELAQHLNRREEVEPILRGFVDFYSGNLELIYLYAALLIDLKRCTEAREHIDTLLLFEPANAQALELMKQVNSQES
ncbi:MAG TPA: glycosyltransferase [Candidatus Hydrogenedentes bacterium]|nr:glycosyltransferase [Candidatus Hydrogenedentota bacterium]